MSRQRVVGVTDTIDSTCRLLSTGVEESHANAHGRQLGVQNAACVSPGDAVPSLQVCMQDAPPLGACALPAPLWVGVAATPSSLVTITPMDIASTGSIAVGEALLLAPLASAPVVGLACCPICCPTKVLRVSLLLLFDVVGDVRGSGSGGDFGWGGVPHSLSCSYSTSEIMSDRLPRGSRPNTKWRDAAWKNTKA